MAFNVVVKHTFLDLESWGDEENPGRSRALTESFAYTQCAKKRFPCTSIDESEDDSTSIAGGSTAEGSTAEGSTGWSDVSAGSSPHTGPSWADIADSVCSGERSRFSTMDLAPVPEASESAERSQFPTASVPEASESAEAKGGVFPQQPPGAHSALSHPPGMFGWGPNQTWPLTFGESKSWGGPPGAHSALYHPQTCGDTWTAVPKASTGEGKTMTQTTSLPVTAANPLSALERAQPEGSRGTSKTKTAASDVPEDERTTLMLRNLPSDFSRDAVADVLDREGFKSRYDFVYMPTDFKNWVAFGYAFVNLVTPADALEAKERFQEFSWPGESGRVCDVLWCGAQQGLEANIERFRSSPVMHESVPDEVRPAVYRGGVRDVFPPPTKAIKMPRMQPRP